MSVDIRDHGGIYGGKSGGGPGDDGGGIETPTGDGALFLQLPGRNPDRFPAKQLSGLPGVNKRALLLAGTTVKKGEVYITGLRTKDGDLPGDAFLKKVSSITNVPGYLEGNEPRIYGGDSNGVYMVGGYQGNDEYEFVAIKVNHNTGDMKLIKEIPRLATKSSSTIFPVIFNEGHMTYISVGEHNYSYNTDNGETKKLKIHSSVSQPEYMKCTQVGIGRVIDGKVFFVDGDSIGFADHSSNEAGAYQHLSFTVGNTIYVVDKSPSAIYSGTLNKKNGKITGFKKLASDNFVANQFVIYYQEGNDFHAIHASEKVETLTTDASGVGDGAIELSGGYLDGAAVFSYRFGTYGSNKLGVDRNFNMGFLSYSWGTNVEDFHVYILGYGYDLLYRGTDFAGKTVLGHIGGRSDFYGSSIQNLEMCLALESGSEGDLVFCEVI